MTDRPTEVALNPVHLTDLPDLFDADGLQIPDLAALPPGGRSGDLQHLLSGLGLVQGGVHSSALGAIQDPAGSAVGTGAPPGGGGASGAIYARFGDLAPIPRIAPRSAIFNSSPGQGRRVLHTHSPQLRGSPRSSLDRLQALEDLANAYANALVAFEARAAHLGDDGGLLNLVPVSAAIYGGRFRDPSLGHLHPSYTIAAVVLALGWLRESGRPPPAALTISFFSPQVFQVATKVLSGRG